MQSPPRREDHRGVDLISDVLPFGRLWYEQVTDAIPAFHDSISDADTINEQIR
jgi:hypothetical protein